MEHEPVVTSPGLRGRPIADPWGLALSPAADGPGLRGVYTDAGVTVRFETYATPTGFRSVLSKNDGSAITEVVKEGGVVGCRVAGIVIGGELTDEQRAHVNAVLDSAEGRAARKVYDALLRVALTEQSSAMSALPASFTRDDPA